jgi:hypothetical protein
MKNDEYSESDSPGRRWKEVVRLEEVARLEPGELDVKLQPGKLNDNHVPRVWHREYWDRFMRDEKHFLQTVAYIHQNPVKARLVAKAEAWQWSSAYLGNARLEPDTTPGNVRLQPGKPDR